MFSNYRNQLLTCNTSDLINTAHLIIYKHYLNMSICFGRMCTLQLEPFPLYRRDMDCLHHFHELPCLKNEIKKWISDQLDICGFILCLGNSVKHIKVMLVPIWPASNMVILQHGKHINIGTKDRQNLPTWSLSTAFRQHSWWCVMVHEKSAIDASFYMALRENIR